jgi:phosphoribosylformimino-5-aminoimidazole carboxamide ribotide isomerase
MMAIPALDLRDNACVQLVGGSYEREQIRLDDPASVAMAWRECGFRSLHLVDLDAATGRGSNFEIVQTILQLSDLCIQVGGGIQTAAQIERALESGASRVIVGTRAIEDQSWLEEVASLFPGTIIVAADVKDRQILTHGWTRSHRKLVLDVIDELNGLPLAGILVTAVHREGLMLGTDLSLMEDVVEAAEFPVHAAGGISGMSDLRGLAERGISAAIIGMALYTGAVDARAVAEEFRE